MKDSMEYRDQSRVMRFFYKLKWYRIAWSLRRLYCPVNSDALVLEVGSGGNPYFRSNVLIDAYIDARERHWQPLVADRPILLGFVENLPFKDKVFDFVIASHVLEHSSDPDRFLSELQRVAKAGYIEVPDAFMERINPYLDHRIVNTVRDGKLIIRKKTSNIVDFELHELYTDRANKVIAGDTMKRFPFDFHVRYYWSDKMNYEIVNPNIDASWPAPEQTNKTPPLTFRAKINKLILGAIRSLFSQNARNKKIVLEELLCCPCCSGDLKFGEVITCNSCSKEYNRVRGIADFTIK